MSHTLAGSTSLDSIFATLDPVGLDTLDALAALRTRVDRKYLVPIETAEALVDAFGDRLQALEVNDRRSFRYESLYFDTPELTAYRGAAHGRRHRFKVRTRVYRDQGTCMLEVKTRGTRGATVKHRIEHATNDRYDITAAGARFIDLHTGTAGLGRALRPTLSTHYTRRTLLDASHDSRITIDTDLEVAGYDGGDVRLGDVAVLETKTASAGALDQDRWLWAHGVRPVAMSKYCVGMALVHPRLPANRWRPILRALSA